jgi:hypothetical protein
VEAVQEAFRKVFHQWGLPALIRIDNGHPWGRHYGLPQGLPLWWMGLGIRVHWNPPNTPQENGVVERTQGVTARWVEPHQCPSVEQLQARATAAGTIQREYYPAVGKQSRLAAYPGLLAGGRAYDPATEEEQWDLERVCDYLARRAWERRVDAAGQVSLYDRPYSAGRSRKGEAITVRFDGATKEWVLYAESDEEIRRWPAEQITRERIVGLAVTHERYLSKFGKGGQPEDGPPGGQPCVG